MCNGIFCNQRIVVVDFNPAVTGGNGCHYKFIVTGICRNGGIKYALDAAINNNNAISGYRQTSIAALGFKPQILFNRGGCWFFAANENNQCQQE